MSYNKLIIARSCNKPSFSLIDDSDDEQLKELKQKSPTEQNIRNVLMDNQLGDLHKKITTKLCKYEAIKNLVDEWNCQEYPNIVGGYYMNLIKRLIEDD